MRAQVEKSATSYAAYAQDPSTSTEGGDIDELIGRLQLQGVIVEDACWKQCEEFVDRFTDALVSAGDDAVFVGRFDASLESTVGAYPGISTVAEYHEPTCGGVR